MYGISDSLPHLGVTLDAFFDIAIAADFLDIQGGLDRYVKEWILELKDEREIGLPTWQWAVIPFVFRHKESFQWSIKTILEHGLTSWEIDGGPTALLRGKCHFNLWQYKACKDCLLTLVLLIEYSETYRARTQATFDVSARCRLHTPCGETASEPR